MYDDVLAIPSDRLCKLFQACVDSTAAPQAWLTAIIAAVKKPKKDGALPESYRTIGLESCRLKTLTLLIDRRLRAWAEDVKRIPDSQNGTRSGFRTFNNAFILRSTHSHREGPRTRKDPLCRLPRPRKRLSFGGPTNTLG